MIARENRRGRWVVAAATTLAVLLPVALTSGSSAAGETAGASATKRVAIVNFAFRPATVTVAKGSTVTFDNTSPVKHTATREGSFDTQAIKPGKSATVRFAKKGTFAYHCMIHPSMHGKVIVD